MYKINIQGLLYSILLILFISNVSLAETSNKKEDAIPKNGIDFINFLDVLEHSDLASGAKEMRNHKAIFTGITRDNARDIPTMLAAFKIIGAKFKDYIVVIFENDSSDDTLNLLQLAASKDKRIKVISHNYNNRKRPSIKFLADIRNKYLEEIEKSKYNSYDILIIVDMDMKYGIDVRGIEYSFSKINEWDAVCSNGIYNKLGMMWDRFAFRDDSMPDGPNELGHTAYWDKTLYHTQRIFGVSAKLHKVESCFGGMAIYKRKFIKDCRYDSIGEDCEHVLFNKCIREQNGGRLYLNPGQMIRYEHYS